jgi:hypothetical protein
MKYFVARQECGRNLLLPFHDNTKRFYSGDNYIYTNNNKREIGLTPKVVRKSSSWRRIVVQLRQLLYSSGSQNVLRSTQGIREQFPGICGYISVKAALKFTYFLIK